MVFEDDVFVLSQGGLRSPLNIEQFQGHRSGGKYGSVTWIMVHDNQVPTQNAITCEKRNILVENKIHIIVNQV